ncbi:hypothetical protein GYH30_011097 [Glycine max]|uniref:Uncharacterized protein n=1 Tax=Glycine max TaxID=3847 RepID=A0A0R0KCR7_SOYBN|nr:hypothetical protein GYH30_011097 [Glycine max]
MQKPTRNMEKEIVTCFNIQVIKDKAQIRQPVLRLTYLLFIGENISNQRYPTGRPCQSVINLTVSNLFNKSCK